MPLASLPAVELGHERHALRQACYALALTLGLAWTASSLGSPGRPPFLAWAGEPLAWLIPPAAALGALVLFFAEMRANETLAQCIALGWLAALLVAGTDWRMPGTPTPALAALALAPALLQPAGVLALVVIALAVPTSTRLPPAVCLSPIAFGLLLEWLITRLRDAARRLALLQAAQSRMVDTIGHEIRTPLTEIKVLMDLLVRVLPLGPPIEQLQRLTPLLHDMRRHCDELAGLVERAQWYQRLAAEQVALNTAETDVSALLREVAVAAGPHAQARQIQLEVDVPPRLVAPVNARALRRACESVLDNALKFTPAGGSARLGCAQRRRRMEIWVDDDGPGIRPEDLPYVCEPFFHREYVIDTSDSQRGIGLGLPIARQIVEAHGGALHIQSTPGRGTCVRLSVPLAGDGSRAPAAGHRSGEYKL